MHHAVYWTGRTVICYRPVSLAGAVCTFEGHVVVRDRGHQHHNTVVHICNAYLYCVCPGGCGSDIFGGI